MVDPDGVETNIVILDLASTTWSAPDFVVALGERGIRGYALGATQVRFVWHLDVDDAGTEAAIDAARHLLAATT